MLLSAEVSTVIPGIRQVGHVEVNTAAGECGVLDLGLIGRLRLHGCTAGTASPPSGPNDRPRGPSQGVSLKDLAGNSGGWAHARSRIGRKRGALIGGAADPQATTGFACPRCKPEIP